MNRHQKKGRRRRMRKNRLTQTEDKRKCWSWQLD